MRRLTVFREQNEEDDTVFNYFDELEIHPDPIGIYAQHYGWTTPCHNITS